MAEHDDLLEAKSLANGIGVFHPRPVCDEGKVIAARPSRSALIEVNEFVSTRERLERPAEYRVVEAAAVEREHRKTASVAADEELSAVQNHPGGKPTRAISAANRLVPLSGSKAGSCPRRMTNHSRNCTDSSSSVSARSCWSAHVYARARQ